jgi:hypothetical protein
MQYMGQRAVFSIAHFKGVGITISTRIVWVRRIAINKCFPIIEALDDLNGGRMFDLHAQEPLGD